MNAVAQIPEQRKSILATMASRYNMEPSAFEQTLRATVVPQNCTKEQFAACLVVANEYRLNPLTKEIYFFPARGGGVVPIVGVDGWCRIINEHSAFDGMEFDTAFENGKVFGVTCRMFRRDRQRPISVTEYFSECSRATDPWKTAPARMLRHKAMIQAARYAFGFSGIYDEDDAERIKADAARDVTPPRPSRPDTPKLSPPNPNAPLPPAESPRPAESEVDWAAELAAYADRIASCEAEEALSETIETFGGVFGDAPEDVRAEARKAEAAQHSYIARQDPSHAAP